MSEDWLADQARPAAALEVTKTISPQRPMRSMVFPLRPYDAVRITIGQESIKLVVCLYPSSLYGFLHAVVLESSKQTLSCLLDQDDYGALLKRTEKAGSPCPLPGHGPPLRPGPAICAGSCTEAACIRLLPVAPGYSNCLHQVLPP